MGRLGGKRIFITGGGSGIGRAAAALFAGELRRRALRVIQTLAKIGRMPLSQMTREPLQLFGRLFRRRDRFFIALIRKGVAAVIDRLGRLLHPRGRQVAEFAIGQFLA